MYVDTQEWTATVANSAEEVLETMFFCSVIGQATTHLDSDTIWARLRFEGEPSGTLTVGISNASARLSTLHFLGLETALDNGLNKSAPSLSQLQQITGELANMMCGNILGKRTPTRTYSLSHPEIVTSPPQTPEGSIVVALEIEEGQFTISLTFDGPEILECA